MMKYLIILVFMMSLIGCSNDGSAERSADKKKTVFDSQLNALEKAKNVENMLQKSADERQREMGNQ